MNIQTSAAVVIGVILTCVVSSNAALVTKLPKVSSDLNDTLLEYVVQDQRQNITSDKLVAYYGLPTTPNKLQLIIPAAGKNLESNYTLRITSTDPEIVSIVEESVVTVYCERVRNTTETLNASTLTDSIHEEPSGNNSAGQQNICLDVTFQARGIWFGYSKLRFSLVGSESVDEELLGYQLIPCVRGPSPVQMVFSLALQVIVIVAHFGMGADMDLVILKEQLRRPKAILIGLLSQFTIMPLLAYGIVMIMGYSGGSALGLFLLGVSPGGTASNMFTKIFNGDITTSIAMTTASTIVSLGMIPFWIYTLGSVIPADEEVGRLVVPFVDILKALAVIIIPVLIGVLIKFKLPRAAAIICKGLKVFFAIVVMFLLAVAIYANLHIFRVLSVGLFASSTALPYGGYLLGGILAWIFRLDWRIIKTIAIETGMQNIMVALLIMQSALKSPDLDLAMIPSITAAVGTAFPLCIALPFYLLWQRLTSQSADGEDEKGKELDRLSDDTSLELSEVGEVDVADEDLLNRKLMIDTRPAV